MDELTTVECVQSKLDPAVFYLRQKGHLIGDVACHIDDFLHC